ncbi:MAG: agmatine deiminase family protein [Planctomycetaceae bacterium]|nr:agmatine deiminase family protein [Planctomycetaceae bacterium]
MPAEWEPHQATWLSWPHNRESWPGKIEAVWPRYAEMVAALARSEPVHINVNDEELERDARRFLQQAGAEGEIHFHHFPTNDAWCRDHGAIFVTRSGADNPLVAIDWDYNAWGGKYPPFDLDQQIPGRMARELGVPSYKGGMILEGGSIEVNGDGLLMTTESCLLNPNRNPDLTRPQIEQRLRDCLGVETIYWLGDGIVGDDTDGHIDDITRFVGRQKIVTAVEADSEDDNFVPLRENLERLREFRTPDGESFEIIELPMPPAVVHEGQRLPASYANFYIGNRVVLLPTYRSARDEEAREVLQSCFPEREVVGIDCTDIVWGLGAFHCLTQQVPLA